MVTLVSGGSVNAEFNTGSAFVASSAGILAQAVRKDSAGALSGVADGDVTPQLVNGSGNTRMHLVSTDVSLGGAVDFVDKVDQASFVNTFSGAGPLSVITTVGAGTTMIASTAAIITRIEWFVTPITPTWPLTDLIEYLVIGTGATVQHNNAGYIASLDFWHSSTANGGTQSNLKGSVDVNIPAGTALKMRRSPLGGTVGFGAYNIGFRFLG